MKHARLILLASFAATQILLFDGCASADAILLNPSIEYPPTEHVELLLDEPNLEYVVIALIEGTATQYNTKSEAIEKMQKKAAQVGAHALIIVSEETDYVSASIVPNPVQGSAPLYVKGGKTLALSGKAIRYLENRER
ncbi:hypothetical protein K8I28_09100 [bacterium]|nr:hypothetical protein [bacterium]